MTKEKFTNHLDELRERWDMPDDTCQTVIDHTDRIIASANRMKKKKTQYAIVEHCIHEFLCGRYPFNT